MALTDTTIRNSKPKEKDYKLSDSQGLYLLIRPNNSKLWYLKFRLEGKESRIGFGSYPEVSLAQAREKRDEAKSLLAQGVNPSSKRTIEKQKTDPMNSFEAIARHWHSGSTGHPHWKEQTAHKILRVLEMHVFPYISNKNINDIKTKDLTKILTKLNDKGLQTTAIRLSPLLSSIFRFAVQKELCLYNPASDLTGFVQPTQTQHRPALTFDRIPELLTRIDTYPLKGGRKATQLALILSLNVFIRSSELRFARWSEIDLDNALWTIPAEREVLEGVRFSQRGAKMRTPHLVPLNLQAVEILKQIKEINGNHVLVFSGDHNPNKPMSENTINRALRIMGYDTKTEICGHGFRSMACSALTESRLWSKEAVERQMSHIERNGVRGAYIHLAEHMEERRLMMQWWADYLDANRESYITPFEFANRAK